MVRLQPWQSMDFVVVCAWDVTVQPTQGDTWDVMVLVHGCSGPPCLFALARVVKAAPRMEKTSVAQGSTEGEQLVTVVVASTVWVGQTRSQWEPTVVVASPHP